jgi:flagellar export protein FliJ
MAVPFRLSTVLRVRQSVRDQHRMALVHEQQRETSLLNERARIVAERTTVVRELCEMHDGGTWAADRALARQQHAEHLSAELDRIGSALTEVTAVIGRCRNALLEADTSVKALEKLAERHASDARRTELATDERERADIRRIA